MAAVLHRTCGGAVGSRSLCRSDPRGPCAQSHAYEPEHGVIPHADPGPVLHKGNRAPVCVYERRNPHSYEAERGCLAIKAVPAGTVVGWLVGELMELDVWEDRARAQRTVASARAVATDESRREVTETRRRSRLSDVPVLSPAKQQQQQQQQQQSPLDTKRARKAPVLESDRHLALRADYLNFYFGARASWRRAARGAVRPGARPLTGQRHRL